MSGVYAVFTRHGWGDPEVEWRGPFEFLQITGSYLLDSEGKRVAREKEPCWWVPEGDEPDFSFRLKITAKKPRT